MLASFSLHTSTFFSTKLWKFKTYVLILFYFGQLKLHQQILDSDIMRKAVFDAINTNWCNSLLLIELSEKERTYVTKVITILNILILKL